MMDFEAKARSLYDKLGRSSTTDTQTIAAALKAAYNQGLEDAAVIAEREHDHYENGDAGWYAADKMRSKKVR